MEKQRNRLNYLSIDELIDHIKFLAQFVFVSPDKDNIK